VPHVLTQLSSLSVRAKTVLIVLVFILTIVLLQLYTLISIAQQTSDASLINKSGRQRMLMIDIAYTAHEIDRGHFGKLAHLQQMVAEFDRVLEEIHTYRHAESGGREPLDQIEADLHAVESDWDKLKRQMGGYIEIAPRKIKAEKYILNHYQTLHDEGYRMVERPLEIDTTGAGTPRLIQLADLLLKMGREVSMLPLRDVASSRPLRELLEHADSLRGEIPAVGALQPDAVSERVSDFLLEIDLFLEQAWLVHESIDRKNDFFSSLHQLRPKVVDGMDSVTTRIADYSQARLVNMLKWESVLGVLGIAIALLISVQLSRGVSRPLRQLTHGIRGIIESGDLEQRVAVSSVNEFSSLAEDFNSLLATQQHSVQSLEESNERFRALVEATSDWIWEVDTEGLYSYVSPKVEELLGYRVEEIVGKSPFALMTEEEAERTGEVYRAAAAAREAFTALENVNIHKSGQLITMESSGIPFFDDAGRLVGYRGISRDISKRKEYEKQIIEQAYYDSLTGLPNRRLLLEHLDNDIHRLKRHGRLGALIFLDLDYFKNINDSLGHPVGDKLLQQVAERIGSQLRKEDLAARLGGDEFIILLSEISDSADSAARNVEVFIHKLRSSLAQPYSIDGHTLYISPSIGITIFPEGGDTVDDILKHADVAMYRAKELGRNTYQFYLPSMQETANQRLLLEKDLRVAVADEQIEVYYQPQVDSAGLVVGAEALVRWNHEQQGFISPVEFIPVAEETGLIFPIGAHVLRTACRLIRQLVDSGVAQHLKSIAVNVSAKQFMQHDFTAQIREVISSEGVPASSIELEITEGVLLNDIDDAVSKMTELREFGIRFSIDDFGTGYSSLSYLTRLPLDKLKIDQSFVRNITSDPADAAIVETIIAMTRHLGIDVIAEGVEREEELNFLQENGCRLYQGYYFSKPVPEDEFLAFLQKR